MANNYNRQLLHEIHKNNHTKICLKAMSNIATNTYTSLYFNRFIDVNTFTNLKMGIYSIVIDNEKFFLNLRKSLGENDCLYIYNKHRAYAEINGEIIPVLLYKHVSNSSIYSDDSTDDMLCYKGNILKMGETFTVIANHEKNLAKGIYLELYDGDFYVYYYENGLQVEESYIRDSKGIYPFPGSYNAKVIKTIPLYDTNGYLVSSVIPPNTLVTLEYRNTKCIVKKIEDNANTMSAKYIYDNDNQCMVYVSNNKISTYSDIIGDKENTITNSVNHYIDQIVVQGSTSLSYAEGTNYQSLDNPAELVSCNGINIITANEDWSKNDFLNLDFKNNIKSLPSGITDVFVLNANSCNAYCILNIGRLIITGNEKWIIDEDLSTDKYTVFFYEFDVATITDNDVSLNCNYFPTTIYSSFVNKTITKECIALGGDETHNGFLIAIPVNKISADIEAFRGLMNELFMKNPVIIEYLLKNTKYKEVLLDEYHVKTFFPNTIVDLGINNAKATIMYRSTTSTYR